MVDLLPAGVISHGLYGGAKWVQNQPNGQMNSWGVLRPGAPLNFSYSPAMVGAGYIACEGKRVCGATMTNDGFGRWSVPSARDLADVFNMIMASNHNYHQYFDMTADKIFERMNLLASEVNRLNLAISRGGGSNSAVSAPAPAPCIIPAAEGPQCGVSLPVVQGQVVSSEAQWQAVPQQAIPQPVREHSFGNGCVNATNPGGWEAIKATERPTPQALPHAPPAPPVKRPQTATRPVSMASKVRAAPPADTPQMASAPSAPSAWPTSQTPGSNEGRPIVGPADPAAAAAWAAELERCAAASAAKGSPWVNGRRQLPGR